MQKKARTALVTAGTLPQHALPHVSPHPASTQRARFWGEKRAGAVLDVLLAVEGHEVERQLLEAVGPLVVQLQLVLQAPRGELGQHDFGQADVVDLEAAPQRAHPLRAQVQRVLADERRLPAACGAWGKEGEMSWGRSCNPC